MTKRSDKASVESAVMRWYRWAAAGLALVLLVVAVAAAFSGNSESVLKEKPVDSSEVYSFSFVSQESGTDRDEFYYTDDFFRQGNSIYDHELAKASLALSMASFKKSFAVSLLEDMGYGSVVSYRYNQTGDEDKAALAMAHKDAGGIQIVAVAVRGGKYGDEWGSNGRVGYDGESFGYHYGFRRAAEDAVVQLKEYSAEHSIDLKTAKIWITGFSRGAAVANVMGALLQDEGTVGPENLFDYTFATPSTVSAGAVPVDQLSGIYNIVNPLDIVTRLPMNAAGISKTSNGRTVRYNWDYVKYGTTLSLPSDSESAQLQVVQLLENALAFATRNEVKYVEKVQDQVIIPALKKTMGAGADVSRRNVGFVLVESLPGVAVFLKDEVDRLDFMARVYVAGILSGKKSIRLEKEHWPETYWGWMEKVDGLE